MITSLHIENFKLWKDTGELRLAPLTVFFGTNSSGKSSISQLLLLLKQTAESPDRRRIVHFGDPKSLVDVGTFLDMIHNHELIRSLKFAFAWTLPEAMRIADTRSSITLQGKELAFSAEVRQSEKTGRLELRYFSYRLMGDGQATFGVKARDNGQQAFDLTASGFVPVRSQGRVWPLRDPVRFYGFPDEAVAYFDNTSFLRDFALALERQLGRISYLGPLRQRPGRSYIWSGEVPEHVGWSGERAIEAILAASDRHISRGYRRRYEPFQGIIARWLQELGLISGFEVRPVGNQRKEYEALVRVGARSPAVTLVDVGFGVSQVLPVLVQCFYVPPESTLIFEQPEIHLHPRVQTGLADLFVDVLSSREAGEDRRTQLLVESHSEHFLRRLQTLIAAERVSPKDVVIYFCDSTPDGVGVIKELEIDLFGRIANWPHHFFGDITGEAEQRTRYMLQRARVNAVGGNA